MKKISVCLAAIVLFAACSGEKKKVVVFSKGDAKVNAEAATVEVTDDGGHQATEALMNGDVTELKLTTPRGSATVNISGKGLFVLNSQKDTIVGSFINYGENKIQVFTPEIIVKQIDSLKQLTQGKNVSAEKKNFFILPNTAAKITDNTSAIIVAPFHNMKSVEAVDGKAPEVYRFYTTQEVRDNIEKVKQTLDKRIVDSLNKH